MFCASNCTLWLKWETLIKKIDIFHFILIVGRCFSKRQSLYETIKKEQMVVEVEAVCRQKVLAVYVYFVYFIYLYYKPLGLFFLIKDHSHT